MTIVGGRVVMGASKAAVAFREFCCKSRLVQKALVCG